MTAAARAASASNPSASSHSTTPPGMPPRPTPEALANLRAGLEETLAHLEKARAHPAKAPPGTPSSAEKLASVGGFLERAIGKLDEFAAQGTPAKKAPRHRPQETGADSADLVAENADPQPIQCDTPAAALPVMPPLPGGMIDVGTMSRAELEEMFARANPGDPRYDRQWAAAQHDQALAGLKQASARQAADQSPAEVHPRQRGRFTLGNPGGPGRPRKVRIVARDVLGIMADVITDEELAQMTKTAVVQAVQGDGGARRWIYQMMFRNSRVSLEEAASAGDSGLSEQELRRLNAEERYGKAMAAAQAAREELEAAQAAEAEAEGAQPDVPAADAADLVPGNECIETALPEMEIAKVEATVETVAEVTPSESAHVTPVGEVRLAPRHGPSTQPWEQPARLPASHLRPDKNAQKRLKTVKNGENGRTEAAVA